MVKKHHWHIWLRLHDKLAVAGNRLNHDHHIQLQDTKILSTKPGYMDWFIREATEMKLQPTKLKDGTLLNRSRKPLIPAFRKQRSLHTPPPKGWLMCSQSFSGSAPIVLAHLPSPNPLVDTPMCWVSQPMSLLQCLTPTNSSPTQTAVVFVVGQMTWSRQY